MKKNLTKKTTVYYGGSVSTEPTSLFNGRSIELFIQVSESPLAFIIPDKRGLICAVKYYISPKNFETPGNYPVAEGLIDYDPESQELILYLGPNGRVRKLLRENSFYAKLFSLMETCAVEYFPETRNLIGRVLGNELSEPFDSPAQYADFYKKAGYQPTESAEYFTKPVSGLRKSTLWARKQVEIADDGTAAQMINRIKAIEELN